MMIKRDANEDFVSIILQIIFHYFIISMAPTRWFRKVVRELFLVPLVYNVVS